MPEEIEQIVGSIEREPLRQGRDEMNLAEFPIGLIADRAENGLKTVVYQNGDETLTVTGSDLLGLPTALDIDVILALMYLTKTKNNFSSTSIHFSRYELIQVLGWADRGYYYQRLTESLNRWVGVTLVYKKSWWDNGTKTKGNRSFHILDSATVIEQEQRRALKESQVAIPLTSVRWSAEFFQSFQANNLKKLDLKLYYSFKSSVTKQLYRFLDKRFYRKGFCSFDLRRLACEHVGMSRNYETWRLKQKLQPAIDELVGVGFLRPMTAHERYTRVGHKLWNVHFERVEPEGQRHEPHLPAEMVQESNPVSELQQELMSRGVSTSVASEFLKMFPQEKIRHQIKVLDWLIGQGKRKIQNPGAYLTKAIRNDFSTPPGFETTAQCQERLNAQKVHQTTVNVESLSLNKRRSTITRQKLQAYWKGLTEEERSQFDKEAVMTASPELLRQYEENRAKNAQLAEVLFRVSIREPYLKSKLGLLQDEVE
ncbi:MAG: replication initiator protein A [bacterium]